jgi:hypothetical protein
MAVPQILASSSITRPAYQKNSANVVRVESLASLCAVAVVRSFACCRHGLLEVQGAAQDEARLRQDGWQQEGRRRRARQGLRRVQGHLRSITLPGFNNLPRLKKVAEKDDAGSTQMHHRSLCACRRGSTPSSRRRSRICSLRSSRSTSLFLHQSRYVLRVISN